jgi:hypothetical protein
MAQESQVMFEPFDLDQEIWRGDKNLETKLDIALLSLAERQLKVKLGAIVSHSITRDFLQNSIATASGLPEIMLFGPQILFSKCPT